MTELRSSAAEGGPTAAPASRSPNPRRVAAGRRNRSKRKGLTPEGRERLRRAAIENRPWRFATGPRTAANARARQKGPRSLREIRAELAGCRGLLETMRATRRSAVGAMHVEV